MRLYETLENLSYKLRAKSLYYELKYFINKKESHIKTFTKYNGRQIGKTYNLMKISGEYRIPVLVSTLSQRERCVRNYYKFKPIVVTPNEFAIRFKSGTVILVDEKQLLDTKTKKMLDGYIQIGFETM